MSTKNTNGEYITEKEIQDKGLIECYMCGRYGEKKHMQPIGNHRKGYPLYMCTSCFNDITDFEQSITEIKDIGDN